MRVVQSVPPRSSRTTNVKVMGVAAATSLLWGASHFDSATGLSAMQRTTGFSIAIVARLLLEGAIGARGVLYQEQCVPAPAFLAALEGHGIRFTG